MTNTKEFIAQQLATLLTQDPNVVQDTSTGTSAGGTAELNQSGIIARAITDIPPGNAIALRTDGGQWYAQSPNAAQLVSSQLVTKRRARPQKSIPTPEIINGVFLGTADYPYLEGPGLFYPLTVATVPPPDGFGDGNSIYGWTLTDGSIDWGNNWVEQQQASGELNLDMSGSDFAGLPGTITQVLQDVVGGTDYTITFWLAGNPGDTGYPNPTIKTLRVSVGSASQDYSFDITGKSPSDMGWTQETFEFTADDDEPTLTFQSTTDPASPFGPMITNVSIALS